MGEVETVRKSPGRSSGRWCRILTLGSGYGALFFALAALTAGFGSRGGLWHFRTGFTILTWAAWGGMVVAVVALLGVIAAINARQLRSGGIALLALIVGALIFVVPYTWQSAARAVPPIHDISTDLEHPPDFVAILPLRRDAPNPADYGGNEVARQQSAAYPDIKAVILNIRPEVAFPRVLAVAHDLGWKIVAEVPAEGRIEATDTTFWFGFTDDIVIRITPVADRSLVDIRSVSRVGRSDVGTNARRIREFMQSLTEAN
jgi:uncharacterized protein (DUF1499 family)